MEKTEVRSGEKGLASIGFMAYNRAGTFLRGALDSLLAQTYKNFELIISDDASTDDTQKICEEYARRDARIRYIRHKENIGNIPNLDFLQKQARGEYFMWACDDDLWDRRYLEKCVAKLSADPEAVMVFANFEDIDYRGKFIRRYDPKFYFPFERDLFKRMKVYTLLYADDLKSVLQYSFWRLDKVRDISMAGYRPVTRNVHWGFNIVFVYMALARGPFDFIDEVLFFRRSRARESKIKERNFIARVSRSIFNRFRYKVFGAPGFYYHIWFVLHIRELSYSKRSYLALLNVYVVARLFFVRKM